MEFVVYHVMYGLNEIPLEQNMESKYLGGALFSFRSSSRSPLTYQFVSEERRGE